MEGRVLLASLRSKTNQVAIPSGRPRARRIRMHLSPLGLNERHRDRHPPPEMLEKIEKGQGFIAALDQSGGSTPGALYVRA
jgi:hypothetical protein